MVDQQVQNEAPQAEAPKEVLKNEYVEVKILKNVGIWKPGDIIKMTEAQAKQICAVSHSHDGQYITEHRKAIRMSELKEIEETPMDVSQMTRLDMLRAGKKNIVQSKAVPGHAMRLRKMEDVVAGKGDEDDIQNAKQAASANRKKNAAKAAKAKNSKKPQQPEQEQKEESDEEAGSEE